MKTLEVLGTPLKEADVAAFEKANPHCRVLHNPSRSFAAALEGVTKIQVRMGFAKFGANDEEAIAFKEADAKKLKAVLDGMKIDPASPGLNCPCSTGPFVEFYRGKDLTALVAYRHGASVEWIGGWAGNWNLEPASIKFLNAWLNKRGAAIPKVPGKTGPVMQPQP